ncbi:hypothetical protein SELMODRAFT_421832 [Selaginella moellendorffii]|uniref:DCD domain-containing protein n=1 Tax=Selaginella moellendorffii TaxID=88036 RepID=D8SGH9_SELML|nr:hypothetical protein SELMODRAFT_421832 [Selaginella moellendorffii]
MAIWEMICNRSIDWEGMLCFSMLCRLICRWKGFVSVCRVRRIIEFVKKRVTLMEKVLNREYHLIFRLNAATAASSLVRDQKTSYQKPQPTFVPYPTHLTPEELLGTALDNDPKRLKVPAYYNEVVFVSPFAKLCWMISENRLDAFQTYAGKKIAGIRLRRFFTLLVGLRMDVHLEQVMQGTHPSPRDSHSSTAVRSKLYVFGGTDGTSPLNDLFVLHTAINTWRKPDVFGDVPAPREGHSASLIGDNLFVFGGYTFVWKKISTTGVSPIPQDSHTCSFYKNCFVVMGGEDGGNAYLNDVYILDTETMAWRDVKTTGAELMLRARHTQQSAMEKMLRGKYPSEPKLSMRKELKRRRQEYRATPFVLDKQRDADKSLVSSHGEFQAHVQLLGEKMFEARVSDIFNYGYILEASINGKLICGLLFSYKPGFAQAVQSYMARFVSFDSQLLSMKHCNLQKYPQCVAKPSTYGSTLIRKSSIQLGEIWSISIHVHTLWDGKSNLQTCQASNLHCRPLLRYYRMKLKDKKILKGRLAKSLEDMHSFYDHGPNVENSSIIKKSCSLAFNLSQIWHKTISNTMHQELAGNYDLQSFQEGMRFTLITANNYQEVVQAQRTLSVLL